jgi:SAM-dependent methyltransferase
MERLPFTSGQIRLLTANASFHYVSDFRATLAEFERVLCPGGVIAILDSPFYENAADGERGIAARVAEFRSKYRIPEDLARKARYFTFEDFRAAASALKLKVSIQPVWPGWQRKREEVHARIRGRGIARFPVVLLEKQPSNV